jgi:hypothetical protein
VGNTCSELARKLSTQGGKRRTTSGPRNFKPTFLALGHKKVAEIYVCKLALLWLCHYNPMTSKQQFEKGHTEIVELLRKHGAKE